MQTFSFSLTNARLAYLLTITRTDETVIRVTTSSRPITISSVTWTPVVLTIGDMVAANDGTLANLSFQVSAKTNGLFDPYEIDLGLFEEAHALLEITNAANPASKDFQFEGRMLGDAEYDLAGNVSFEILNLYGTPRDVFVRKYTIECDADFGDPRRCKIPTFPNVDPTSQDLHDVDRLEVLTLGERRRFRYDADDTPEDYHNVYWEVTTAGTTGASDPSTPSDTPDDTVTDGSVTFTVRDAWARYAQVDSIIDERHIELTALPDPRASDDTWYAPGRLIMRSGFCKNRSSKINAWDGTTFILEMVSPFASLLEIGDWLEIAPDCDKTLDMCVDKYDNANNYRGFPHITGARLATSTFIPGTTDVPGPTDDPGAGGGGGSYSAYAVEFEEGAG